MRDGKSSYPIIDCSLSRSSQSIPFPLACTYCFFLLLDTSPLIILRISSPQIPHNIDLVFRLFIAWDKRVFFLNWQVQSVGSVIHFPSSSSSSSFFPPSTSLPLCSSLEYRSFWLPYPQMRMEFDRSNSSKTWRCE